MNTKFLDQASSFDDALTKLGVDPTQIDQGVSRFKIKKLSKLEANAVDLFLNKEKNVLIGTPLKAGKSTALIIYLLSKVQNVVAEKFGL